MIKLIGFYLGIDIFLKSFNILSLSIITPLVDVKYQEIIVDYTIAFTLMMSLVSFSQLGLVPKTTRIKDNILRFDASVFLVGILPLFVVFAFSLYSQYYIYSYASLAGIFSFSYQAHQSGNNIYFKLKDIVHADFLWIALSITILASLLYFEIYDERLRIYSHFGGLLLVGIFVLRKSRFYIDANFISHLWSNINIGFWMTIYASLQWFFAFGDKLILDINGYQGEMITVFIMTNIMQLQLLGSLALVKAFKANLLRFTLSCDKKNIIKMTIFHGILTALGSISCIVIYKVYIIYFDTAGVSSAVLGLYALLYFFVGILYFLYQIVIFIDEQMAVSLYILWLILPLLIFISWVFSLIDYPIIIPSSFAFLALLTVIIVLKILVQSTYWNPISQPK